LLPFLALGFKIHNNRSYLVTKKENEMKRPFGVTLIAILALIGGLFGLCWPTLAFMGSALLPGVFGQIGVIAGIFLIIGPILQLVFSYGAFKLRSWAWYLGLIASGVVLIGVIIHLINGASIFSALWGSVLSIIIFIYLLTPNVRNAFGTAGEKAEAIEPAAQPQPAPPIEPTPPSEAPVPPVEPTPSETPEPAEEPESTEAPDQGEEAE
jgi:hypothetical protein